MRTAVAELAQAVGVAQACEAFNFPRSTFYRLRQPAVPQSPAETSQRRSHRGLTSEEKQTVRALLNSERFCDLSPRQVYATLLDEGEYYCSLSTMYRILREHGESQERRAQRSRPQYVRPELLATAPNQVWSWDITWLKGPHKWQHFYLYVILDVFSRYVTGWLLADQESGELAEQLIAETCRKQGIAPDQLTLHADRGAPMTAQSVAQLLEDLGVAKSHSRPYTSDDNPFSESQFKTMKYRPDYPERFDGFGHAHDWARVFFAWYNNHHRHSGIGLMTPATVHFGRAAQLSAHRQAVLQAAYQAHPERFVNGVPTPPAMPDAVWINPPAHPASACPAVRETVPGAQSVSRVSGSESLRPLTQTSTGPQSDTAGRAVVHTTIRV